MGLFDAEGQSHNTVYALHRFMLGIYCMTVGRSCKGKRVLPNRWHKRLRHINNLRKRRLRTIMLVSQSDLQSRYLSCISHFQLLPASPGLLGGIFPPCQSRGWCICKFCAARGPGICQPRGHSRAFDTHSVSYQNISTRGILLGKKADLLICQGHE